MGNPTTTPLQESWHDGGFIVSEANGHRSRDAITVALSALVLAGTVLGIQTTGATAVEEAMGTNTGNGTFSAITVGAGAVPGAYVVAFDAATSFNVSNPQGEQIGHGNTGVAFEDGGLGFTITAGGTAFAAGDAFTVTVAQGSGKWVKSVATAVDGSQVPAGILYGEVDATSADKSATGIVRDCEVNGKELVWDASYTATPKAAAIAKLATLGIIVR